MVEESRAEPINRRALAGIAVLASLIAMVALGLAAFAEPQKAQKVQNIVLVHGAFADASSWSGVITRLQKAGYRVRAVQLALDSFEEDVARTRNVLAAQPGPTLLVGHSFGGAIITEAGSSAPNVVGLVYESAFAPDQGESMKAIVTRGPAPPGARAFRPDKAGGLWLDVDSFKEVFAADVDDDQARVMAAVQKPIASSELMSERAFGKPAWRGHPSWYLVTEQDLMLPPDAQRAFAKRMGATVQSLAASHAAMVSHPDEVAAFILRAAAGPAKMAAAQ
ncbi:MAG TPA: alpha/beta hydrolase [Polyangia bacterium]|nr:alpha/beta hydrolase [Polyangia bacterium]